VYEYLDGRLTKFVSMLLILCKGEIEVSVLFFERFGEAFPVTCLKLSLIVMFNWVPTSGKYIAIQIKKYRIYQTVSQIVKMKIKTDFK
jgi:hypothetical protein